MANRFRGSYRRVAEKSREHGPRGIARMVRWEKDSEARERNAATPHNRTKRHRLNRCACSSR